MKRFSLLIIATIFYFFTYSQGRDFTFCYGNISVTIFDGGKAQMTRYDQSGTAIKTLSGEFNLYGKGGPTELLKISFDGSSEEFSYDLIRNGNGTPAVIIDRQGRKYEVCKTTNHNAQNIKPIDDFRVSTDKFINYNSEIVKDIDGNEYKTVKIGNQIWMAQNLKTKRYRNGDMIPKISDADMWMNLSYGAYSIYGNEEAYTSVYGIQRAPYNETVYGCLYNWYAVSDTRNIAPDGWHIPTKEEWKELIDFLGGLDVAGGKLKENSANYWASPNSGASNSSGFGGLPGGYHGDKRSQGAYNALNNCGFYWSTTKKDSNSGYGIVLYHNNTEVDLREFMINQGLSIRCIKDAPVSSQSSNQSTSLISQKQTSNTETNETIKDIDGNLYNTVKIGTQVWMVENLKTTKYRNGDKIPNITNIETWPNLTTGAYCSMWNDSLIVSQDGLLYNWHAATDSRNIAPKGWHVPNSDEWKTLFDFLGGIKSAQSKLIKKSGFFYRQGGDNSSGFTAVPGGQLDRGTFCGEGMEAWWWTSSESNETGRAICVKLPNFNNDISSTIQSGIKGNGFSIRCVKDVPVPSQSSKQSTSSANQENVTNAINSENLVISNVKSQEEIAKEIHDKGYKQYANKDFANALSNFNEAIKLNPKSSGSYFFSALCLNELNRTKEAIEFLNKCIEIEANSPKVNSARALCYRGIFKFNLDNSDTTACNDLKRACEMGSSDACDAVKELCK